MIDHDIPRFHISVHDPSRVHEIQCLLERSGELVDGLTDDMIPAHLEQLKCIILDVELVQHGEERLPLHVLHVLHHETVVARRGVLDDVPQRDDVRAPRQVAEHLDFALDLLWGDRLEDFDDARLRVDHVDAFEDLCGVNQIGRGARSGRWPLPQNTFHLQCVR